MRLFIIMTLTAKITVITDIYMFTDIHTTENLKEYFHPKERGKKHEHEERKNYHLSLSQKRRSVAPPPERSDLSPR